MLRLTLALAIAGSAFAAEAPSPHTRALAAGYKAGFLCSDIFVAGRSEAQAAADDLTGIYPEYQALVTELPAVVDRAAKTVRVAFSSTLPPRVAAWRPHLGCAQLPIGANPEAAAALPRIDLPPGDLAASDRRAWPLGDADAGKPSRSRRLVSIVGAAFDRATYGSGTETTAVIVLVDGRIVAERYRTDFDMHTPQRTWSVAKSLTATLVGRAARLGLIDVKAAPEIPEWTAIPGDPRARISFEQLLRMNSGLWTDGPGNRTDALYLGGSTVGETAAAMPLEVAPGSRFRYANNDILLAARGLRTPLGRAEQSFPMVELLWPLGMTRTTPETDWQGGFVLSSQVWMTARDLARLALLYQNDGVSGGTRLLPEGWARFVASPAGAQPAEGPGYGAGFWLFGPAQGLPDGTYAMQGNRGQYAMILPGGIVVVRRGFDGPATRFDIARFAADIRAALPR